MTGTDFWLWDSLAGTLASFLVINIWRSRPGLESAERERDSGSGGTFNELQAKLYIYMKSGATQTSDRIKDI